ncbi:MAG: hypothetical protein IJ060_08010 [Oscillospiraceae bacterium]|nr:hypothetical protein [Oscillospiraceae bacterium]
MKATKAFLIGALVMAVFAIALLTDFPKWYKYRKGDVKNFNEISSAELNEGDLVKGHIYVTYGAAVERQETKKRFGITTSKSTTMKYYCVLTTDKQCILYSTNKSDEYALLDRYANDLEAFYTKLNGDPDSLTENDVPVLELPFEAVVQKLPKDVNNLFAEWYEDGYEEDCNSKVYLSRANFDGYQTTVFIGFGLAGGAVILLVLFIFFTVKGKKGAQYGY